MRHLLTRLLLDCEVKRDGPAIGSAATHATGNPRGWLTIVRGNPASALDGLGLTLAAPVWLTRAGA